jgi:hypothetical protein
MASECLHGPVPENPDNRVGLCSPTPSEVTVSIVPEGLQLSWDAPPRETTAYVSPVLATHWTDVDSALAVPSIRLAGNYLALRDRRIELSIASVTDSLGGVPSDSVGAFGSHRVRVAWTSIYEASASGAIGGVLDVPRGYSGQLLRFDIPNQNPAFPPDTTALAGLRVAFTAGGRVKLQDTSIFDVEDFEGWHIWRWGADPTSPNYLGAGEYSKLADRASPTAAWPGHTGTMRRVTFVDHNVFDGFLYHYAITSYDQGFRRSTSGTDLAVKFDSPLHLATQNSDGSVTLGSTQIRVSFRRPPPSEFEPVAAVPNPFRESEAIAGSPETQVVQFINSPPQGTLYIWTVAGDLVRTITQNQANVGVLEWDTKNEGGEKVTSGVYIFKIIDLVSGQQSFGRLAIIR